ncbi:hypothetical protein V1281_006607 [Nitrobacteraceae bacterium AZCC 2161]
MAGTSSAKTRFALSPGHDERECRPRLRLSSEVIAWFHGSDDIALHQLLDI